MAAARASKSSGNYTVFVKIIALIAVFALPALIGFDPTSQEIPGTWVWKSLGIVPDVQFDHQDEPVHLVHAVVPVVPQRPGSPYVLQRPQRPAPQAAAQEPERAKAPEPPEPPEPEPPEAPQPEPAQEKAEEPLMKEAEGPPKSQPGLPAPIWIFCAGQWQDCPCRGDVRWGTGDKWKLVPLKAGKKEHTVKCSIDKLGDPAFGEDSKHCQCAVQPGTPYYDSLNPALLPAAKDDAGSNLATSCDVLKEGAKEEPWGRIQWESVAAFCDADWSKSAAAEPQDKAGPRALKIDILRTLMKSWIDPRFMSNYKKFFDQSGWTPRAFVNYYAGPPHGKHCSMTEELIKSVHEFSKEPILVYHYGKETPEDWNAEKYPQLVLLHAAPLPANAGRSFNFNKLRSMLLSRAKVGVQLDSDQFVAPGCDAMFGFTEREVTKDYAMPVLPAHFLDRTPRDTGAYWERFCPKDKCKFQTARWGHAHPTWTYWALPFLGRWLRRNHRDETLPAKEGGQMAALRIINVPEDEDLLNIATWEEKGTKQWCKYDLPGPGDFNALVQNRGSDMNACTSTCGDITSDSRYHPKGVAKAFYTAHHAVDPGETRRWVKHLSDKARKGALPPPVLFKHRFYKDGDELRAAHADISCII